MSRLLIILLIAFTTSCSSPFFSTFSHNKKSDIAHNGVLDLRNSNVNLVKLDGQWKFYPGRHIISVTTDEHHVDVMNIQVPMWWDKILSQYFSDIPKGQGFGSYQLTIYLPDHIVDSELLFYLNHFLGSYRLFINDGFETHKFYGSGDPSPDKSKNIDNCWEIAVKKLIPKNNKIVITVEASNYTYGSGGFHTAPAIGLAPIIESALLRHKAICYFVIGALFVCLLFNFSLIILHNDGQTFWILLLCGATIFNFLHRVMPNLLPDKVETRLFLLSFHLLFVAYLLYFHRTTIKQVSSNETRLGLILNTIPEILKYMVWTFTFCVLFFPSTYTIFFVEIFRAVPLLMIAYMIFSSIWLIFMGCKISNKMRVEILIHAVSIAGLTFASIISVFFHDNKRYGADSYAFLAQAFGGISLVLSQTITVLYRSSILRQQAEKDRHQLENVVRTNFSLESIIRRKTEFIAMMNHEIRTPLNHIIGFSGLLYNELKKTEFGKYLQKITIQSNWLIQLVNSLIDVARIDSDAIEISKRWVSINDFFFEIRKFFAHQFEIKNLYLKIVLYPLFSKNQFYVDDIRLRQVIINIVSNAVKFTKSGGIIITVKKEMSMLIIKIADTGIGISNMDKKNIFVPFNRGSRPSIIQKTDGIGLGLNIAEHLITKMNGTISFDSKIDIGTTFKIVLPDTKFRKVDGDSTAQYDYDIIKAKEYSYKSNTASDLNIAPNLNSILQNKLKQYNKIKKRKVFKEINQFASEIREIGMAFNDSNLISYSDRLTKNVQSFDVDGINKELDNFKKIADSFN